MPKDPQLDDSDAQKKHGEKIRFERDLQRVTGLSRSQIRQSLAAFDVRNKPSPAQALSAVMTKVEPPIIRTESVSFQPIRAAASAPTAPADSPTPAAASALEDFTFVNNDGVLAVYSIPATFVEFP